MKELPKVKRRFKYKYSLQDVQRMIDSLDLFRFYAEDISQRRRLGCIPFVQFDTVYLFNLEYLTGIPCNLFGKHLVLKIIDELLDCELKRLTNLEEVDNETT